MSTLLRELREIEDARDVADIEGWVTVFQAQNGKWDVRLREGVDSYLLVFVDLPRREMAEGFAERIRASIRAYSYALIDCVGEEDAQRAVDDNGM